MAPHTQVGFFLVPFLVILDSFIGWGVEDSLASELPEELQVGLARWWRAHGGEALCLDYPFPLPWWLMGPPQQLGGLQRPQELA